MMVNVWTVHADDSWGRRTTLHLTEKQAHKQWLRLQFPDESDDEEKADRKAAAAFIEDEDYDGLWEWKGDRDFGDLSDTYTIEDHVIEIPDVLSQ